MRRFAIALVLLVPLLMGSKCSGAKVEGGKNLNPYWRAQQLVRAGTDIFSPKGATIYPEAGVTVDETEKRMIDQGLDSVFRKVRCNYPNHPNAHPDHPGFRYGEWDIAVFESELTPAGNAAFRVPVDGYAGTRWDRGGFIYAAAMVTGVVGETYTIALPDVKAGKYEAFKNGADYEGEHWWLATVDADKYEATKVHGAGQGHPIISGCPGSLRAQPHLHAISPKYDVGRGFAGKQVFYCIIPAE